MTLSVRHVSASGRLDNDERWSFDRGDWRIDATVRMGARLVPVVVYACSQARPRLGAHPLARVDGETWRVLPVRYVRAWPNGLETLIAVACPIGDVLAPGEALALTQTPPNIDQELDQL